MNLPSHRATRWRSPSMASARCKIPYVIMNWQELYNPQRTGSKTSSERSTAGVRTSFLRDYDRIIFSSAFRRLQNKTQVFPLPGPVFVHNRLTHSLEVASVGRTLGKAVGGILGDKYAGL